MQQIQIKGRVGKDAVIKSTNGKDITLFSVCVDSSYINNNGEKVEKSTWYSCLYKRSGVAAHIKKGDLIFVQGELSAQIYVNDRREPSLDLSISVSRIEFLGSKSKDNES
ncbi:single-stranded DNA-binding protein [Runella sp. SP2]|uniref:single-stranded DNA-binding protein n=1 Tax=Runella sp. SP2 TaxID=2268026 RepID=UPI000F096FDA|nr:single-stranded DNA-binding protein [Runella sp. SP2]AYQ31960.1 single-stranded DNA-binding protein [Runella sp. SP2]